MQNDVLREAVVQDVRGSGNEVGVGVGDTARTQTSLVPGGC